MPVGDVPCRLNNLRLKWKSTDSELLHFLNSCLTSLARIKIECLTYTVAVTQYAHDVVLTYIQRP